MKYTMLVIGFAVTAGACTVGWLTWQQGQIPVEKRLIDIQSSREPELGLRIYAQFTVTQRLTLREPHLVSRLSFPAYFSPLEESLIVELWRHGEVVQHWIVAPKNFPAQAVSEVSLALDPPQILGGDVEVHFAAAAVPADQADVAPRLFVESADGQYPGGNYRVAQNEKKGDVSLTIYERLPQWQVWQRGVNGTWWQATIRRLGIASLLLVLFVVLPWQLFRLLRFKPGAG